MTPPLIQTAPQTDPAARRVVATSTLGFTLMFAVWVMFAIVGLPIRKQLGLTDGEFTLLTALPVLTGSLLRLPAGLMADRFGGKRMFVYNLLITAVFAFALCFAHSYGSLLALSLGVGLAGVSFAIGNAWIAQWVPTQRRGLALGTFGAGNAGASLTKLLAPLLIAVIPAALPVFGGWRFVPFLLSVLLLLAAVLVQVLAPADTAVRPVRTLTAWLAPLKFAQVWRFGLYYVVFFGAYVAMSLYLPKFYVDTYDVPLPQAGLLTALFIFPASLLRPLGGYLSDRFGPRSVTVASFAAMLAGLVPLTVLAAPSLVTVTALMLFVGAGMGVGKASTYTLVAQWFPRDMGVVGGLVGLLGGLGGFALPLIFSALKPTLGVHAAFETLLVTSLIASAVFLVSMQRLRARGLRPSVAAAGD